MLPQYHNISNSKVYSFPIVGFLIVSIISLALAGYPLVAAISTLTDFSNRAMSICYRVFYFIICSITIYYYFVNKIKIKRDWIWLPLLMFWFAYLLRLSFDTYVNPINLSHEPYEYWIWVIGGSLIPMLALMGQMNKPLIIRAMNWSFILLTLSSILTLIAFSDEMTKGLAVSLESGRLSLRSLNPIAVGHLGGSLIIVSTMMLVMRVNEITSNLSNAIYLIAFALGLGLMVTAASRGPIVATVFALVIFVMSKIGRRHAITSMLSIGALAITSFYFTISIDEFTGFKPITRIIGSLQLSDDPSINIRLQAYYGAWQQFAGSPFIGSAIEEKTIGFYPHNLILEAFMATGVVGGFAFLILLGYAIISAWKLLRTESSFYWIALLFLQYFMGAMFSGSIWSSTTMWILMAGVFSLARYQNCSIRYV